MAKARAANRLARGVSAIMPASDLVNLSGLIPIGLSADLIDGLGDPGIAREGGKPSGFVT